MSKVCQVTGKRPVVGNNVSHFPEPVIKAHGRSSSRYGIKAVDTWERNRGLLESLEIQPLITPHS